MPPELDLGSGIALITREASVEISGEASDDERVRDLYIYAGARKVFYQSNRGEGDDPRRAAFAATIPLRPGVNYVSVFARESDDSVTRRTFVVRRDGSDGELLETPERDDDVFGFDHGE
jgi:carboxyl-terminal processing protease